MAIKPFVAATAPSRPPFETPRLIFGLRSPEPNGSGLLSSAGIQSKMGNGTSEKKVCENWLPPETTKKL
jgi:hypothetical protein